MDLNGGMEKTLHLRGYLLEVEVKYPQGLHENHNELPFLVEKMKIVREEKLVPNLKIKRDMWYT